MSNKTNIKLYKIYKMFALDLLFYYAINFLFLTQAKNLSASKIFLANAFYPFFKLVLQVPCTKISERIGKAKSIFLGNILVNIGVFILIISQNFYTVLISYLFMSAGFCFKALCESSLLYDSIVANEKKHDLFSKLYGKSTAGFFYFDAFAASIAGLLFLVNSYLPMIMCLLCSITATVISYNFAEPENSEPKHLEPNTSLVDRFKFSIQSTKFIIKSRKIKSSSFVFWIIYCNFIYI